ncbi:glycosyltransferase family protein [Vibrio caribbeanicus]|uniref:glycosyltransferase family protein n=1 Tax=Vibrio caribbeanicus TaxID=701175 RepID=UPI00068F6896|nr:glycosyltransferase [Vibrio caribbeanicus]
MKKLLFYSHDSYGLGNIRRMVAIATYLVSKHQDLYVLLITGSPMYHAFRTHPQIDYVKLPCLSRDTTGAYHPRLKCFDTPKVKSLRAQLILDTYHQFQPDVCVIDKKPTGLSGELLPLFEYSSTQHKCKHLLLLRDILDSPSKTIPVWCKHHYHQVIEQHYQEVLVVGDASIFDLPLEYDFPTTVRRKTTFCGYLIPPREHLSAHGHDTPNQRKKVLVAVGGGNDGQMLVDTYLHAVLLADFPSHLEHHIVLGPEMDEQQANQLTQRAKQLAHLTIERFNPNLVSLIQAADLVISMAGYNTVCELMSCNTPAILLPRTTPVEEQLIRAQRLAKRGIFDYLNPETLTPTMLVHKVCTLMECHKKPQQNAAINQTGMQVVEDKILSHLL